MRRALAALTVALIAIAAYGDQKALTNEEVVKLVKLGLGDEVVIAKIRQAPVIQFKLETEDLAALKSSGVSGKVITAMLDRSSNGVGGSVAAHAAVPAPGVGALNEMTGILDASDGQKNINMHQGELHESNYLGFAGAAYLIFPGSRCSVRTGDHRPTLTIRSDTSPQEQIWIVKLDPDHKDNDRSLKIGSFWKGGGGFSSKKAANPDPDWTVPYDATESPSGVWHLVPRKDLSTGGEYGVYFRNGFLLDFGVD